MTSLEKKEYIKNLIEKGDKRSWNEISADLELLLWTSKFKGTQLQDINNEDKKEGKDTGTEGEG